MNIALVMSFVVSAVDPRIENTVVAALGQADCGARIHSALVKSFADDVPVSAWTSWCNGLGVLKKVVSGESDSIEVETTTGRWKISFAFDERGRITGLGAGPGGVPSAEVPLDEALEQLRASSGVPALAVLAVDHGKVVMSGQVGVRQQGGAATVTADDRWHLGSDTKAMTAALAGILVDSSDITWGTTVGAVFADWDDVHPGYATVTLSDLLRHLSGLPEQVTHDAWSAKTREGVVHAMLRKAPSARGTYVYSNVGYMTAGVMLERSRKKTWEEIMTNRLFRPLGMTSCGFGSAGPEQPWGHRGVSTPVAPGPGADNPPALGPAGTVHCSLADWSKFVAMVMRGYNGEKSLLSKETAAKLVTSVGSSAYAYGWGTSKADWANGLVISHAGSNTMFYALVEAAPEKQVAFFAVTNSGEGADVCARAVEMVRGRVLR